jgi:hypothetical protein
MRVQGPAQFLLAVAVVAATGGCGTQTTTARKLPVDPNVARCVGSWNRSIAALGATRRAWDLKKTRALVAVDNGGHCRVALDPVCAPTAGLTGAWIWSERANRWHELPVQADRYFDDLTQLQQLRRRPNAQVVGAAGTLAPLPRA